MVYVHKYGEPLTRWYSFQSRESANNFTKEIAGTFSLKEGPCMELAWVKELFNEMMETEVDIHLEI